MILNFRPKSQTTAKSKLCTAADGEHSTSQFATGNNTAASASTDPLLRCSSSCRHSAIFPAEWRIALNALDITTYSTSAINEYP
jgi:hypothetical protein